MAGSKDGSDLYAILFRSATAPDLDSAGVYRVVLESSRSNRRCGVTALLLYAGWSARKDLAGLFVQWVEGPREAVEEVYERICCCKRHIDCTKLAEGRTVDLIGCNERLVPGQVMAFETVSLGALPTTPAGMARYARKRPQSSGMSGLRTPVHYACGGRYTR